MRHSLGLLSLFVGCLFLQDLNRGRAAEPANAKTDAASTGHVYTPPKADPPSIAAASDQGERQIASFKVGRRIEDQTLGRRADGGQSGLHFGR